MRFYCTLVQAFKSWWGRGDSRTHRQQGHIINLLLFLQNKESRLKNGLCSLWLAYPCHFIKNNYSTPSERPHNPIKLSQCNDVLQTQRPRNCGLHSQLGQESSSPPQLPARLWSTSCLLSNGYGGPSYFKTCLLVYELITNDESRMNPFRAWVWVLSYDWRSVGQSVLEWSTHLGLRPDFYYCQTIAGLLMWGALSDERMGLSFRITTGPRQRSHSRVRVP
jgi:hypothetical protein